MKEAWKKDENKEPRRVTSDWTSLGRGHFLYGIFNFHSCMESIFRRVIGMVGRVRDNRQTLFDAGIESQLPIRCR